MLPLRSDVSDQATATAGSVASWILAVAGWSLSDVQQIVAIGSGIAAMLVSMLTMWFMLRNRGGRSS
jgi:hypothetical protein